MPDVAEKPTNINAACERKNVEPKLTGKIPCLPD